METRKVVGYERVTVDNTAGGVALASIPAGALGATMRVKTGTGAICYRADGTNPTSATGMEIEPGEVFIPDGRLASFKAIRRDSLSGTLIVEYFSVDN